MTANIAMTITAVMVLSVNITTMFLTFPCRYKLPFSIGILVLFTAAYYPLANSGVMVLERFSLQGLAFLPLMLWLMKGQFFQKIFAFFFQLFLTVFLSTLSSLAVSLIVPVDSRVYYTVRLFVFIIVFAGYITLVIKFGRRMFGKLFVSGKRGEWAFYAAGGAASYAVLTVLRFVSIDGRVYILWVLFMFWSFMTLCFAIINTHEKSKQKYEVEFGRGIISAGREHYEKMNEMHDKLRIIRHDIKHHLNVITELAKAGDTKELEQYLSDWQESAAENELCYYCENPVLNALFSRYGELCARCGISFNAVLNMPGRFSISNYELCIIFGNLLENAVEACRKLNESKDIELVVDTKGEMFTVMVKNSFNGNVIEIDEIPTSEKKDGGFGLWSVRAICERYDGHMLVEWDNNIFTVYVMLLI